VACGIYMAARDGGAPGRRRPVVYHYGRPAQPGKSQRSDSGGKL